MFLLLSSLNENIETICMNLFQLFAHHLENSTYDGTHKNFSMEV